MKPLPGTRKEVELISAKWRESTAEPVTALLGAAASEDQEPAPVSGSDGEEVEELVLEADETRRT